MRGAESAVLGSYRPFLLRPSTRDNLLASSLLAFFRFGRDGFQAVPGLLGDLIPVLPDLIDNWVLNHENLPSVLPGYRLPGTRNLASGRPIRRRGR